MKKMLFKSMIVISFLLITFFLSYIKSYAASFKYADFNWEEFSKQNNNYWISLCPDYDEDCRDRILNTKERYYKRLYSLLAEFEKKYGFIDDNLIIATSFFGLDGEKFQDPNEVYDPYNLDDSDDSQTKNKYFGSGFDAAAISYFEEEKDSLKTLINSFLGYRSICYGVANETPQTVTDNNGQTYTTCSNGYEVYENKCVSNLDSYSGNFFDALGISFLGSGNREKCKEKAQKEGFSNIEFKPNSTQEVSEEFFWDFLENEEYLDKKDHLKDYYNGVLIKVNKDSMKVLTSEEKKEHQEEIIGVRKRIIKRIRELTDKYKNISEQFKSVESENKYWWPIGSDETTKVGETIVASGEPSKTYISNKYGLHTSSKPDVEKTKHNGIDILGELGITNVIASNDGIISSVVSDCVDGDKICGDGFGNHIIIQHLDGNYTLYAHLFSGSISIKTGDSVKRGEVIAKIGNSGLSESPHLHFEIRVGGNDLASAQDPLNYVSASDPRPLGTSSQILEWIGNMEGTGPTQGDYYVVYADSGGVLTVGHGITLKFNAEALKSRGYDPARLSLGSLVPKSVVDEIYHEDVGERLNNIRALMGTKGITLNENQIAALASLQFNCGNINGFFEAYNSYGSSQQLCTTWWHNKALYDQKGNRLEGLVKRRKAECDLFVNGNYNMNVYG